MRPAKAPSRSRHGEENVQSSQTRGNTKERTAAAKTTGHGEALSSNRLLRWLKKSVGIKPRVKKQSSGFSHPRAQRSLSFVFEKEREPTNLTTSIRSHDPKEDRKYHTTGSGSTHVRTLECPPPTFPRSIHDSPQETPVRRRSKHEKLPHVLIIGAGIGGLCLAQGLKKAGIRFTVFERDPSPNFTTQGYRIQINTMGYEALKATLSAELFDSFLRSAGAIFPTTTTRDCLHGLRYEGVEIKYDMAFKRFHVLPNGIVEVHFDNGRFTQGTMLVGADGTASRVRQQFLSRHIKVFDTDSGLIYGKTLLTPALEELALASDTRTTIISQDPKMALIIEPQCSSPVDMTKFPSTLPREGGADGPQELPKLHKYLCWVLLARLDIFVSTESKKSKTCIRWLRMKSRTWLWISRLGGIQRCGLSSIYRRASGLRSCGSRPWLPK